MTVIANGTHAKDIALHFVDRTTGRATKAIMAKTVTQAKSLLESDYEKKEIIDAIDYVIDVKGVQMYSLGYISASINTILLEMKQQKEINLAKEQIASSQVQQKEVIHDEESTSRNQRKANGFGAKSRIREKFNFNMFEE
jgi:hypothetical protein